MTAGLVVVLGFLLTSCSFPRATGVAAPQAYTRIARTDTNTVELQIAVRKFVPVRHGGPVIWLVGTSHIGDVEYYRALQKHLDAQTVVLYEGVNAGAHKHHAREAVASADAAPVQEKAVPDKNKTNEVQGIQATLAKSLGLVFQLDAIDYDRTNFLNSDLSIQEIQRLMMGEEENSSAHAGQTVRPGGRGNPSFQYLIQVMDGSSFLGSMMRLGVQFLGSSAKLQAITKLTLIETLGGLKGDLSQLQGMPPDLQQLVKVLIEARNQRVIEDLKKESKLMPRSGSIAIFYGTGHMDNMEKRITRDMKYRAAEEMWLTAFSVDTRKSGLSAGEMEMVRSLVKWQLDQMQQ